MTATEMSAVKDGVAGGVSLYVWVKNAYLFFILAFLLVDTCVPLQIHFHESLSTMHSLAPLPGLLLIIYAFIRKEIDLRFNGLKALLALQLVVIITTAIHHQYALIDNIKAICWMMIPIFLVFCPAKCEPTEQRLRFALQTVLILGLVFGVLCLASIIMYLNGFSETIQLEGFSYSLRQGFVDGRLFGIFTDPNYAALIALLLSSGLAAVIASRKYGQLSSAVCVAAIIIMLVYVIASGSRGATVCLFVMALACGIVSLGNRFHHGKNRQLIKNAVLVLVAFAFCAIACSLIVLFGGVQQTGDSSVSDSSIAGALNALWGSRVDVANNADISNNRFKIWADALAIWQTTPLIGATPRGFLDYAADVLGNIYIVQRQYMLHSAYLSVLVYSGIFGAIAVAAWFVSVARAIWQYLMDENPSALDRHYYTALFMSTGLIAVLVDCCVLSGIFYQNQFSDFLFWFYAGTVLSLAVDWKYAREGEVPVKKIAAIVE